MRVRNWPATAYGGGRNWLFVLIASFTVMPGRSSGAGPGSGEIEEIVVTARKVSEDIFRVPMSVSTLSGDMLQMTKIDDLYEMQFEVPGLVATTAGLWGSHLAIRGVSDDGGRSPTVATSLDGVALDQAGAALTRLFDVERVEVLKGPQGTLYGRNATGGAINVINRSPEGDFSAAIEGSYGSFGTVRTEGYVSLSASKYVAIRVAGLASEGGGFIRNTADHRRFAEEDYNGVRASVRLTPSDKLTLDLRSQTVSDDGGIAELWLPRIDYLVDPKDIYLTTVTQDNPFLATTDRVSSMTADYRPGRLLMRSISAYGKSLTRNLDDCGVVVGLPSCVRGARPDDHAQWSQEFHLVSLPKARNQWIVGAYYLENDSYTRFYTDVPLRLPFPINDYVAVGHGNAWAIFGDATWVLDSHWGAITGLRVNRESSRRTSSGTGINDNPIPVTRRGTWGNTSWRIGIQFAPSRDALMYATVTTGFRSGGLSAGTAGGEYDTYDPEYLTAYESGLNWKSHSGRHDLRAAVFVYDYQDMQVQSTVLIDTRLQSVVDNAAKARIHGLELTSTTHIGGSWTLTAGAVWLAQREFIDFTNELTGDVLSGNQLTRAPELTASLALSFQHSLRHLGDFSVRLGYNRRSDFYFTKENEPWSLQHGFGLLNLVLRLEAGSGRWYVFATGRNLLGSDYFNQVFLQSSPGRPKTVEAGFGWRFR